MVLYAPDGTQVLDIEVDDESYAYSEIMGKSELTLKFSLTEFMEIPVGTHCAFEGVTYTLQKPESLTLHHRRNWEYTLVMHTDAERLRSVMYQNPDDFRLKFTATGRASDHMSLLVRCLRSKDGSAWTSLVDPSVGGEKTVSYDFVNCREALESISEAFGTEWEVDGLSLKLGKVEYGRSTPISMSYGKGNGFLPGVRRTNYDDETPLTKVYVQGGDRNIDFSKYGAKTLHMPPGKTLLYDGSEFGSGDEYRTDANGCAVTRVASSGLNEGALDLTHLYPSRVGTVSSVVVVDEGKHFYDIVDGSIPDSLDYSRCLIAGEKMTIIFQTGMLAGREFDIATNDSGGLMYDHTARKFEIVPCEQDGIVMPGGAYVPAAGDTYAVFHCSLPGAYVRDDASKTGASWDMFREAVKYLHEHARSRYSVGGEMDGIWAKERWASISPNIRPGGYVSFTDPSFMAEPFLVRIQNVRRYVNRPRSPEIQLSNTPSRGGVVSSLRKLEGEDVKTKESVGASIEYSKRRFRDVSETIGAVGALVGDLKKDFTPGISPITVQTMMLLLGDESLQFHFVSGRESQSVVPAPVTWDPAGKKMVCGRGYIWHRTVGVDYLTNERTSAQGRWWEMNASDISAAGGQSLSPESHYYLYARCAKTAVAGVYALSAGTMPFDDGTFYNLLVGILNSEYGGDRSFASMYGFTEIGPGRMTIDRIQNPSGSLVIDLINSTIKGRIAFRSSDGTYKDVSSVDTFVSKTLGPKVSQLDGKVVSWFGTTAPKFAASERPAHDGDRWYNPSTDVLKKYVASSNAWVVDTNPAAVAAYRLAASAKDTADGKRRTFRTQPYPPYDPGDIWTQGPRGDILTCVTGRQSGSFSDSDWSLSSKYTDDSALQNFVNVTYGDDMSSIRSQLDGKIESWFQYDDPSAEWTTEDEIGRHVGDAWFDRSSNVLMFFRRVGISSIAPLFGRSPVHLWKRTSYPTWSSSQNASHAGDVFLNTSTKKVYQFSLDGGAYGWVQMGADASSEMRALMSRPDVSDGAALNTGSATPSGVPGDLWLRNSTMYRHNGSDWFGMLSELGCWQRTYDQDAIDAYNSAAAAQDTADGKRRTFVDQPVPPYDPGDLWVNAPFGAKENQILKCVTGKKEGHPFAAADWGLASEYDSTQVTIDNGVVTAGKVVLVGTDGRQKAGVTGGGTDDSAIRFWAGSADADKASAPFRVTQGGRVHMSEGDIVGDVRVGGSFASSFRPFAGATGNAGALKPTDHFDNMLVRPAPYPDTQPDTSVTLYLLTEGASEIGRRVTVFPVNEDRFRIETVVSDGGPTSHERNALTFYDGGVKRSYIMAKSECLELLCVGDSDAGRFDYWLVVHRTPLLSRGPSVPFDVLAYGSVPGKTYNTSAYTVMAKTHDGSSVTASRIAQGRYTVNLKIDISGAMVMLTGRGAEINNPGGTSPIKATLLSVGSSSFDVATSDDETVNDGAFDFLIFRY